MTRPKASRYPVSSFGPELLSILIKGARERVELPCEDQRFMKHLQMRLQMLRGAMEREGHPQYALVTRARTSRTWNAALGPDHECVLIVQPNDAQFVSTAKAAGVTTSDHERDLLEDIDAPASIPDEIAAVPDPYAKFK